MHARTLRILLIAAATSVLVSWLLDALSEGFRGGPAVIAAVLIALAAMGIAVTVRREARRRRTAKEHR